MSYSKFLPSVLVSILCIGSYFFSEVLTLGHGSSVWGILGFHFFHANIFHLLLNIVSLWIFHPRWTTVAVGYAVASLAAAVLVVMDVDMLLSRPTIGLSAMLFACFSRKYVSWHLPVWKVLVANIILAFLPMFSWAIHLMAFFGGYAVWYAIYRRG